MPPKDYYSSLFESQDHYYDSMAYAISHITPQEAPETIDVEYEEVEPKLLEAE